MSNTRFTAAAAQMTSGDDLSANLATCARLASEARDRDVNLLVLPECFAFLGRSEKEKFAVAERLDPARPGPVLAALQSMARDNALWLIAGGTPETLPEEADAEQLTRTFNTCIALSPTGETVATYRKIHLFDIDIPGGAVLRESDSTARGDEVVVAETELGQIGLSICYDLRFPELYRELVMNRGAELVVVPAAFTAYTGKFHWHTLLRSRAIENQCYVIAAAQTGRHNEKRESYGHSTIIDPWGTVLDELPDGTGLAVAEIDLERVSETRRKMPCHEHRVLK